MEDKTTYNFEQTEAIVARAHQRASGLPLGDIRINLLLKHNAWLLTELLNRTLEPYGLTSVGYVAMIVVYSTPDNLANPSDLCVSTRETRSNMTRICDELVEKGLMKRSASAEDRRRIDLSLTEAGLDFLNMVMPLIRQRCAAIFNVLSDEEKMAFEATLMKLKQALESPP